MNVVNSFLNQMLDFENNDLLGPEINSNWPSIGLRYGYFDFDAEKGYSDQIKDIDRLINEKKFHIKKGLSKQEYEALAKRCPFKIPKVLEEFWQRTDGFFSAWNFADVYGSRTEFSNIKSSILPMVGAFGGRVEIDASYSMTKDNRLLFRPLLSYEPFSTNMEICYKDASQVDVHKILENSIILEIFSEDALTYTLCKLDYKEAKCPQLYLTYGNGIYPLTISLEEYFEAIIEFKGIIFAWPILFIDEKNVSRFLLDDKRYALERAKYVNRLLELEIDFKNNRLLNR